MMPQWNKRILAFLLNCLALVLCQLQPLGNNFPPRRLIEEYLRHLGLFSFPPQACCLVTCHNTMLLTCRTRTPDADDKQQEELMMSLRRGESKRDKSRGFASAAKSPPREF